MEDTGLIYYIKTTTMLILRRDGCQSTSLCIHIVSGGNVNDFRPYT